VRSTSSYSVLSLQGLLTATLSPNIFSGPRKNCSLVMLVAAGLFVRTLSNLHSIELGFNRENVLLFQLDARKAGHKDPEIAAFYGALRERFRAIPGVRNASLEEDSLIKAGHGLPISVAGSPPHPTNRFLTVGPAYFTTMQIPILA